MNKTPEDILDYVRIELEAVKPTATFFAVVAYKSPITDEDVCKIVSNSNKQGVNAIMCMLLAFPSSLVHRIAHAMAFNAAKAASDALQQDTDMASLVAASRAMIQPEHPASPVFLRQAQALLDEIRAGLTVQGWEGDAPNQN